VNRLEVPGGADDSGARCLRRRTQLDGPTNGDDPLAQTFDALAQRSATSGDLARSDGFSHAAIAVRSGVTPTRIEVTNGGQSEAFDAFATSVDWELGIPAPTRPPARRNMVAWRRSIDGTLRVLTLSTPRDSAAIISPLSLGATSSRPPSPELRRCTTRGSR
jgi:hypothetical protein